MPAVLSGVLLAALILVTAGCAGPAEDTPVKQGSAASGSTSPGTASGGQKEAVDSGAVSAGIDQLHPPKPVTSYTAPTRYLEDPSATARFDIYSIKRQGKLAILTMSVTPTFSTVDPASLYSLMGDQGFSPTLVDPVNLREYEVVRSGSGKLSSSEFQTKTRSGQPLFVWAAFAAPPANVGKINLNLYDTMASITDVPVQ